MNQKYLLDISDQSRSINNTPILPLQKLPFYVHGWGHFYANASYYTERDGLENYLLIYTLSGNGHLTYQDTSYRLNPSSVVVFNCINAHLYQTESQQPWEFLYIHFNGAAAPLYESMLNEKELTILSIDYSESLFDELSKIYPLILSTDYNKDLKICAIITSIYTKLITHKKSTPDSTKHPHYEKEINRIIQFMQSNYNKKLSTEDLATRMVLSKFHFLRVFKAYTGSSPYEYLINYRISQSKVLLEETNFSIGEICDLIGFNDVNNYIRYFKKVVGTTPGGYRKNWI